jgi:hypothetical protein
MRIQLVPFSRLREKVREARMRVLHRRDEADIEG